MDIAKASDLELVNELEDVIDAISRDPGSYIKLMNHKYKLRDEIFKRMNSD